MFYMRWCVFNECWNEQISDRIKKGDLLNGNAKIMCIIETEGDKNLKVDMIINESFKMTFLAYNKIRKE